MIDQFGRFVDGTRNLLADMYILDPQTRLPYMPGMGVLGAPSQVANQPILATQMGPASTRQNNQVPNNQNTNPVPLPMPRPNYNPQPVPPILNNTNLNPNTGGILQVQPQLARRDAAGLNTSGSMRQPVGVNPMMNRNEILMRMAGAGLEAVDKGGAAQIGAALSAYGTAMDEARDQLATLPTATAAQQQKTQDALNGYDQAIIEMDTVLERLKSGDNVSGMFGGGDIFAFKDKLFGNDPDNARRNTTRLMMSKLKVDNILLSTAQTKGAISDREMALFAEPVPTMQDEGQTWINWITQRQQLLKTIRYRLVNNITVRNPARYIPDTLSAPDNLQVDDITNALIQQYTQ